MDFDELVRSRRCIRQYTSDDVSDDLILKLLEAARFAPSAGNCQPWHFYVVKNDAVRKRLCEKAYFADWLRQAPVIIVVCVIPDITSQRYQTRGKELYCIQDTAAAVQNILLSAKSNGLGTCWIGAFNEDACREALQISDDMRPVAMIPVGYTVSDPPERPRKPVDEIATFI